VQLTVALTWTEASGVAPWMKSAPLSAPRMVNQTVPLLIGKPAGTVVVQVKPCQNPSGAPPGIWRLTTKGMPAVVAALVLLAWVAVPSIKSYSLASAQVELLEMPPQVWLPLLMVQMASKLNVTA
jgi:hypothetical protein